MPGDGVWPPAEGDQFSWDSFDRRELQKLLVGARKALFEAQDRCLRFERGTIASQVGATETETQLKPVCRAPFASLYLNTDGNVLACCQNTGFVLGNVAERSLSEIWTGPRVNLLRQALLESRYDLGCDFCRWQAESGQPENAFARIFDRFPLTAAEPDWPKMLQFAMSNTCNLACIMCNGSLSSTIRRQREGLPIQESPYTQPFFDDLRRFLPHLEEAEFLGGEPFLEDECFRVWDLMVEERAIVPIQISTNATVFNSRVKSLLETFPVRLLVSIDGVTKSTVEAIRVGARFETIQKNLRRFMEMCAADSGGGVTLAFCLMRQNWREFGDFLAYADSLGLPVFVNRVVTPDHCSLFTLAPEELQEIADQLSAQSERYAGLALNGRVWSLTLQELYANARQTQVGLAQEIRDPSKNKESMAHAWNLATRGDYAEALTALEDLRDDQRDGYEGLVLQGLCLRQLDRVSEAIPVLQRATWLFPHGPKARVELAWAHLAAGVPEAASAEASRALKTAPKGSHPDALAQILNVLAIACTYCGKHDAALEHSERAEELCPRDQWVLLNRATCLQRAGKTSEALHKVQSALDVNPALVEARNLRDQLRTDDG